MRKHFLKTSDEISEWLDLMDVKNYIINDDLTVDVKGNVLLDKKRLNNLPVKINHVSGSFLISKNFLNNMKWHENSSINIYIFSCLARTSLAWIIPSQLILST